MPVPDFAALIPGYTRYCGWDLIATKRNIILHLEVKGHRGDVIQFELTPNEYEKMQKMDQTYRVCVVRQALTSDAVEVYAPKRMASGAWELCSENGKSKVSLVPHVAARASEIA